MARIDIIIAAFLLSAGASLLFMRCFVRALEALQLFEIPNARSSHARPVVTGGGWVVILSALALWLMFVTELTYGHMVLVTCVLLIACVSWIDDMRPLSPVLRLVAQIASIAVLLTLIPASERIIWSGLPFWADRLITGLAWLWFVNLYNFMDGVDGMAAVETIAVAIGIVIIGYFSDIDFDAELLAAVLAGSAVGFLYWNWAPARIILGDVGSISLGLILGWLLIQLARHGHLVPAIILTLFFTGDATFTLLKRMVLKEPFWKPHRKHFYQQPVVAGQSHAFVSGRVAMLNCVLIAAAVAAMKWPIPAGLAALAAVVAVLIFFNRFRVEDIDDEQSKA